MTPGRVMTLIEADICVKRDDADAFRKESLPMAYYYEGFADGLTLALRYMEQIDIKEAAMPASTAANPL